MKKALALCHNHLGDDATILYCDAGVPSSIMASVKGEGKQAGGPWEGFNADKYFGWESERVVAVTGGERIMELITRARTHLAVILVGAIGFRGETDRYFQQAAEKGLAEMIQMGQLTKSCQRS